MRVRLALAAAALIAPAASAQAYDCLMDPAESLELSSPAAGLLDEVLVRRGEAVTRGQVVARLNSAIEESTVELLEIRAHSTEVIDAQAEQLALITQRYRRVADLRERGIATQDAFDQVEAERIAAQSLLVQAELNRDIAIKELARARAALGLRTIVSPIDGIVAERLLSPGEYADSDDAVMRIVQLDPLTIEAFLPVSLFGSVEEGDVASVRPAPPLDGVYPATVTAVDRVFDAASGTFVVQLELPNPDGTLPAGHRCDLSLGDG